MTRPQKWQKKYMPGLKLISALRREKGKLAAINKHVFGFLSKK